jgi:hypothetical protein
VHPGEVIARVQTVLNGSSFKTTNIDEGNWLHPNAKLTLDDFDTFAIQVWGRLLTYKLPALESLAVGVRLDIGTTSDHTGFFVSEVTRWWAADFFNKHVTSPKLLCRVFADRFSSSFLADTCSKHSQDGRTSYC